MEHSSVEFLKMSIGILSFPFDFPTGMHLTMLSNSSRVNGLTRKSFSSAVNCGRLRLDRKVAISDSEQVSLFSNKDERCDAAMEHISLCELVIPRVPLRYGMVLETDLSH